MSGDRESMDVRPGDTKTEEGRGHRSTHRRPMPRVVQAALSPEMFGTLGRIRFALEQGGHDDLVDEMLEVFNRLVQLQESNEEASTQNEALKQTVIRLTQI